MREKLSHYDKKKKVFVINCIFTKNVLNQIGKPKFHSEGIVTIFLKVEYFPSIIQKDKILIYGHLLIYANHGPVFLADLYLNAGSQLFQKL